MKQLNQNSLWISFGNKQQEISMHEIKELRYSDTLKKNIQDYGFEKIIVLDQQHTARGVCVEKIEIKQESWFEYSADFLVTNTKGIALVVLTADCIPLVLYDQKNDVVALVHAGWRGLAGNIVFQALQMMQNLYGTQLHDIVSTVGPNARSCCYEVSAPFIDGFQQFEWSPRALIKRGDRWYFNKVLFLQEQLQALGVPTENMSTSYAVCTICDTSFCSFRREKQTGGRQATIVALR